MSLADWQISLISASIGTAIPLVFVLLREIQVERKRKNQIRNALCAELTLARDALAQSLATGKTNEEREDDLFIPYELPVFQSFPLNTTFYDDITIEALATNISNEALRSLPVTYNMINRLNRMRRSVMGGFFIEKSEVTNLITQIDKTVNFVKDC